MAATVTGDRVASLGGDRTVTATKTPLSRAAEANICELAGRGFCVKDICRIVRVGDQQARHALRKAGIPAPRPAKKAAVPPEPRAGDEYPGGEWLCGWCHSRVRTWVCLSCESAAAADRERRGVRQIPLRGTR